MRFSIVMPIYNVQDYLNDSVSDLQGQSFTDFELILVDDCSPDLSGVLCDNFTKDDRRIRVIHLPKNGGLSNARNQGMASAKGEYILFLDPDDRYDKNLLKEIDHSLEKNNAKLVLFGLMEEYYDQGGEIEYKKQIVPVTGYFQTAQEVRKQVLDLETRTLFGYAWNKAYRLSYLQQLGLEFEKITMIEDVLFNIRVFEELDSCNLIGKSLYHYAIRKQGSLTTKYLPDYFDLHAKRVESICRLYKKWHMLTPEVLNRMGSIYCRYFLSALQRNCSDAANMHFLDRRRWVKRQFESQIYRRLKPFLHPDNRLLKLLAWGIRTEKAVFCVLIGRGIYIIKEKYPNVFSRLKQNR